MTLNPVDISIFVLSVPALWLMGNKKKSCFVVFTLVNILMVTICLASEPKLWGVMAMQFVYMAFNVRNFILWTKSDTKTETEKYTP